MNKEKINLNDFNITKIVSLDEINTIKQDWQKLVNGKEETNIYKESILKYMGKALKLVSLSS